MTISKQKCSIQKCNFLFTKKISFQSLYLVIICNLTHLQDGNTKVKFTLRIIEKNHVGSETGFGYGYGSETN
jgi:hypothetical protein